MDENNDLIPGSTDVEKRANRYGGKMNKCDLAQLTWRQDRPGRKKDSMLLIFAHGSTDMEITDNNKNNVT